MVDARAGHAAVATDRRLYVCGGRGSAGVTAKAEVFDPVAGSWKNLPPMLDPRKRHAMAAKGTSLYVCGGWALSSSWTFEQFDIATETWAALPAPPALNLQDSDHIGLAIGAVSRYAFHVLVCLEAQPVRALDFDF